MAYFLGMDAGGSKTFAVITDEKGQILGTGKSGNGNHQLGRVMAEKNIRAATDEALRAAGLVKEQIDFAWFGLAGADRETDFKILRPLIGRLNLPKHDISGDTIIALRAGTLNPYGVVIICGSGVNCAGLNTHGDLYQCGGFSYMHGDFGGGGGLAVEVYRSVIRAWDGRGEPTLLTSLLLDMLNYASVEEMFHDFLDHNKRVPHDATKLLFPAARQGDHVARHILEYQGKELGLSAKAVIHRLGMHEDQFDIVLAGSVLTRSDDEIIHKNIEQVVLPVAPRSTLKTLTVEPVVGALLLAMEKAGHPITADTYENLRGITDLGVI